MGLWQQNYAPVGNSLALSTLAAGFPILVLLYLLGVRRTPAWIAALSGLGAAALVALLAYGMPLALVASAVAYGGAFGLLPIGWIVYWAIVLYRITLTTRKFEVIKSSIGGITSDRRLQGLLVAFAFGAFVEGAAGFGTPVAVAAAMLVGLGFSPFYAAGLCLIANTAPVAFGSIGTPVVTLAGITGLDKLQLSGAVGRICAPVSLIVPAYLVVVMAGFRGLRGVAPAALTCGVSFAGAQYLVATRVGPELTDIVSSLVAMGALVALFRFWRPRDGPTPPEKGAPPGSLARHSAGEILLAWSPYLALVALVLLWGYGPIRSALDAATLGISWPGLHGRVVRVPPFVAQPAPYDAMFRLSWLSASGTSCLVACVLSAFWLGMTARQAAGVAVATFRQLFLSLVTIVAVLALAFLMNYSGATVTLGLAFGATGALFPFFSALLGWLGVFLTGSDTSANALFGNLQVVTATRLGLDPVLMAAANSSGGVMGKMISLQSIAVAAAATGMAGPEESRLFRLTLKHSIALASLIGLIVVIYSRTIYAGP